MISSLGNFFSSVPFCGAVQAPISAAGLDNAMAMKDNTNAKKGSDLRIFHGPLFFDRTSPMISGLIIWVNSCCRFSSLIPKVVCGRVPRCKKNSRQILLIYSSFEAFYVLVHLHIVAWMGKFAHFCANCGKRQPWFSHAFQISNTLFQLYGLLIYGPSF